MARIDFYKLFRTFKSVGMALQFGAKLKIRADIMVWIVSVFLNHSEDLEQY